jgi:NDP-4-keto-2,6-dideoxyhexose 3-C-methyltransferase
VNFNDINGGSFRVYACHDDARFSSATEKITGVLKSENQLGLTTTQPFTAFRKRVDKVKDTLHSFLSGEKAKGKSIYIYGASTKGNVLLQYCNIGNDIITAAADKNPEKWGRRTPGTNIPIISEEEARRDKPDYFLVLPWHFQKEFVNREADYLANGGKFIFPLPEIRVI